ncbi:hypothetical protein HETIRDRAFT_106312 [Heterobasidion irregulare TC 32-1]|uniref:Mon2/Sec7/BIG1-like dimerisation and cyclophilin-binding domain-containing protein n=1 Tax=Heterobasidion irregulare (strain TC 32-1) TaxID=747525 RepID=W4JU25_HETIT|nr:uncharacterized protein HETIRDRAFT_106312 [Heterobasidion irregulare TC 32-1]ETW76959.1 hypothetical protein HETIRDRAFT_106312 [Heterobasidion irregulare TC 32-1]
MSAAEAFCSTNAPTPTLPDNAPSIRLPQFRHPRTRCKTRPRAETALATACTTPRPPGSPPPTPHARSTPTPRSPHACPPHSSTPPSSHKRSMSIPQSNSVSTMLFTSALDTAPLREGVDIALEIVRAGMGDDHPREIFKPLCLACETRNEKLMVASLDCISKLISYSFFIEARPPEHASSRPRPCPRSDLPPPSLVDLVVHTITTCRTETTADLVRLQVVKALLALVLSSTILVHQSSLLKAVCTVYNVFLMSTDPVNQTAARGGLTQMVHHILSHSKVAPPVTAESTASLASKADDAPFAKHDSFSPSMPDTEPPRALPS